MGGLRRVPVTGELVGEEGVPVLGQPSLHWRSPVIEQTLAQFGNVFSKRGRPLKPREVELARPIFGASIHYDPVRVVHVDFVGSPTTLGNWIRVVDLGKFNDAILLHELTHVWQYQTQGTRYMSDSLCAQVGAILDSGDRNRAYDIHPSQLSNVRSLLDLAVEKQARLVEMYFVATLMRSSDPEDRKEARRIAYSHIAAEFSYPNEERARGNEEFAHLERLIAEIKRFRPMEPVRRYLESLSPPPPLDSPHDDRHEMHPMPVFRIDW